MRTQDKAFKQFAKDCKKHFGRKMFADFDSVSPIEFQPFLTREKSTRNAPSILKH